MPLTPHAKDPRRNERMRDRQENPTNWGVIPDDAKHQRQKAKAGKDGGPPDGSNGSGK